jgi:hypothetical protein
VKHITLCVPGGTAGQIFALTYAIWLAENKNYKTHIRFYDIGTSISSLAIEPLLESPVAKELGISYEAIRGNLHWHKKNTKGVLLNLGLARVRGHQMWRRLGELKERALKNWLGSESNASRESSGSSGVIREEELELLSKPGFLIGYPTDLRIVEAGWRTLKQMFVESGLPEFASRPGLEELISIHWRLGDFVANGDSVAWESIEACLAALPQNLKIDIYTDSPNLAQDLVANSKYVPRIHFKSQDIWTDLFDMTRARYFVGSTSGISFLAALAVQEESAESTVYLPDLWLENHDLQLEYKRGVSTFRHATLFPALTIPSNYDARESPSGK